MRIYLYLDKSSLNNEVSAVYMEYCKSTQKQLINRQSRTATHENFVSMSMHKMNRPKSHFKQILEHFPYKLRKENSLCVCTRNWINFYLLIYLSLFRQTCTRNTPWAKFTTVNKMLRLVKIIHIFTIKIKGLLSRLV